MKPQHTPPFATQGRRLWSAVTCHRQHRELRANVTSLNATLLRRQVGKARKAVTSHRTPKNA
jgi:hypothetical protein